MGDKHGYILAQRSPYLLHTPRHILHDQSPREEGRAERAVIKRKRSIRPAEGGNTCQVESPQGHNLGDVIADTDAPPAYLKLRVTAEAIKTRLFTLSLRPAERSFVSPGLGVERNCVDARHAVEAIDTVSLSDGGALELR